MLTLFYLIGFFVLIQKAYNVFTIKKYAVRKHRLDKTLREKAIDFFGDWDDEIRMSLIFKIPEIMWMLVGVLTGGWFAFVLLLWLNHSLDF